MTEQIFVELSAIIIVTTIVAWVAKIFKQPMIIAYIAAGLLLSPYGLNIVTAHETVATFSQIGVAFLLFMVGLSLSPRIIKTVGKISIITGLGQIIFTSSIGFGIALLLGFSAIEAIYIAVAFTFSSTIVIMKLLSDKKDMETLYAKISMGFLIVQDIVAILILIFVASFADNGSVSALLLKSLLKVVGSITLVVLIGHYILPRVLNKIASSVEFVMLFCVAWCFALASAFHMIGLSIEIGALLAGVSLSMSPYRHEISSRIRPLRDFFLLMFFVFLGSQMEFSNFGNYSLAILVFSLFILIGNPFIVMVLMGVSRYTKKTGFLAGLTVAQISEFSLILIALGIKLGHIEPDILSFATVTGLITIGGSSYFIIYGKKLYHLLNPYLNIFERKGRKLDEHVTNKGDKYDYVLLGYNNIGLSLSRMFKRLKKKFLVVDYNPEIINELMERKTSCLYSDIEDDNLFEKVNFAKTKMVISSIKNPDINFHLIKQIRNCNKKAIVIVVAERSEDAIECYEKGANYVIMPNQLGGQHVSTLIEHFGLDMDKFVRNKIKHLEQLNPA
ncbi:MAG: cation:proton antiporter [Candidatus Gracilibacteria bacterium]|nr:cation:proton antiporter [Candidatus Gracilibacteria bacterium]